MVGDMTERIYLLRSCNADFSSAHDGSFVWPSTVGAEVEPRAWDPTPECGNGLHGFVRGEGDSSLADWSKSAQWLVFSADPADVIDLQGRKAKVRVARVEHVGQGATGQDRRLDCLAYLDRIGRCGAAAMGVMRQGGDRSTLTGGDRSTLTGGYGSTLTGGYRSTLTGGYGSTLTGGYRSTLTAKWWDGTRYRITIGYVGEDGIKADKPYRLNDKGKFCEVRSRR